MDEVENAIKGLKHRKAPGWDKVQNKDMAFGGQNLTKFFYIV